MHPIQPPNYPARSSDKAATAVKEKPPGAQVNYSDREMNEAVLSGKNRRKARIISQRGTFLNNPLAPGKAEISADADKVAEVFRRSRKGKLNPLNPCQVSHPARRGGDNPAIKDIRRIKADEFLAHQIAEREQTTIWVNDDKASRQGVSDHRGATARGFDRTCGAIVQQPSGNSSPVRQQFFAAEFYSLFSELDTNEAEQLFHNLSGDQQDQFRNYCLQNIDLGKNEKLMELLFQ